MKIGVAIVKFRYGAEDNFSYQLLSKDDLKAALEIKHMWEDDIIRNYKINQKPHLADTIEMYTEYVKSFEVIYLDELIIDDEFIKTLYSNITYQKVLNVQ
jgi:hypothetical protein